MEIERKFLISKENLPADLDAYPHHKLEQGYLSTAPVVRIRKEDDNYYLTYKSKGLMTREEYNLPLTKESYEHMRPKADGILISKTRYLIPEKDRLTIELDVFDAPYEGLYLAEVEFSSEEQALSYNPPVWFGKDVTLRLGVERYYKYFRQFGLLDKTGTDLPGEAGTIMHQKKNMGEVELATVSFGQSFQITPVQLAATVSSLINGGRRVTPHFGVAVLNPDRTEGEKLIFSVKEGIVSEETSKEIREILETVVSQGSGKNAKIEGYAIGGKTATSQTLPRSANRYISSFLGFAPAEDPQILGLCIIHDPKGIYYGGTVAAPVIRGIFENILPYLGIEKSDVSDFSAEGN